MRLDRHSIEQGAQRLRRALAALGAPGIAGLLALLLAAPLALGLVPRWEREAQQLRERLAQAPAQRLAEAAAARAAEAQSPQQWRAALPEASERQRRLADLLEMALRAGLNGTRTEHRLSSDAGSGLERLRVSMPVQGSYQQLRRFIETALQHDPALSLDSLKLRRANPGMAELEAELQWSLHARLAGGAR